jgi:hypothetical protein
MRNVLLFGLAVLVLTCTATAYGDFTAYNDFVSPYTGDGNVTRWGMPAAGSPQALKDQATGATVTPTMTGTYYHMSDNTAAGASEIASGTDAYAIFNGKVSSKTSTMAYSSSFSPINQWYVTLDFKDLNPANTYNVAAVIDRGSSGADYDNKRWTLISLQDADASTYASSTGAYQVSPTDVSIDNYNTIHGYVAKWTGIQPGPDGDFTVRFASAAYAQIPPEYRDLLGSQAGKGYGPAGIMLQEVVPEPSTLVLLAVGALAALWYGVRRRK